MYGKWNKNQELIDKVVALIPTVHSYAELFKHLDLEASGANYTGASRLCKRLGLDTSHFTGMAHLRGKTHSWNKTRSFSEILVEDSTYGSSSHLKRRLIKAGLLRALCHECGALPEWRGRPLTLQLDHVNGVNDDNRLENLRLLCPNCHSQTDTYCGRNKN